MTNEEMARSYMRIARQVFRQAEQSAETQLYSLAVRRSQETVEMSLKAVLRLFGVEVPRVHDVGMFMKQKKELFPPWFGKQLDRIAMISRRLRNDREVSLYGDETLELPPDEIFGPVDAENALSEARFILEDCAKLLDEHETA